MECHFQNRGEFHFHASGSECTTELDGSEPYGAHGDEEIDLEASWQIMGTRVTPGTAERSPFMVGGSHSWESSAEDRKDVGLVVRPGRQTSLGQELLHQGSDTAHGHHYYHVYHVIRCY